MATATVTKLRNFIGGEFVDPAEGETEDVVNPATGEVIAEAPLSTEEDVDRAVGAARGAFETAGRPRPRRERSTALLRSSPTRSRSTPRRSPTSSRPTPASRAGLSARTRSRSMVDNIRFFAGAGAQLEGRVAGEYIEGHTSIIRREPVGVVGQITPWNYPMMMAVWKIGPALATGYTLVLKPAETTPVTTSQAPAEIAAEFSPPASSTSSAATASPPARRSSPTPTSTWSR